MKKSCQVSFFGIFGGRGGAVKAEYMRDFFHPILFND